MSMKKFIIFSLLSLVFFNTSFVFCKEKNEYDEYFDDDVVVLNKKTNSFELTPSQKKLLEYFLLERDSKLAAMQKELDISKKLFIEELSKPNNEISSIELENLVQEIDEIASTMERIKIDFHLNIRNAVSPKQYSVFIQEQEQAKKQEQEQKNKKKKK